MSSKSAAATDAAPVVTLGTPYQETSPSFPLPQHEERRPKTAGATTSTIGGVSVPTHRTTGLQRPPDPTPKPPEAPPPKPTEKSEKRKTRLLNPMALLSRRRSAQDEEVISAEKAAQEAALARQRNIATTGGISRNPINYDPSIRGRGVHDFSAPRKPRRGYSYSEVEPDVEEYMRRPGSPTGDPSPKTKPTPEYTHPQGPKLTFAHQAFQSSPITSPTASTFPSTKQMGHPRREPGQGSSTDSGSHMSSRRTTGFFQEHLNDSADAGNAGASGGRIQAERLENKDFLQRASFLSQQSGVSSVESAVLPPFARRSQVVADEAKGNGQRDSTVSDSSISGVSPVTTGLPDMRASQNMSPVSPNSDKRVSTQAPSSGRSSRTSDRNRKDRAKSSSIGSSLSDAWSNIRPFSSSEAPPSPGRKPAETSPPRGGPPISITIPTGPGPMPSRFPPEIPPRGPSATTFVAGSPLSTINSPALELASGAPTPEPMVADSVRFSTASAAPPRLVEKRKSAVGHGKRGMGWQSKSNGNGNGPESAKGSGKDSGKSSGKGSQKSNGVPKHHMSNASRFSFQMGSAEEERALEEKARKVREGMGYGKGTLVDGSDEEFDEDAMDDLDEMEMMGLQQEDDDDLPALNTARSISTAPPANSLVVGEKPRDRASVANFMYRPATSIAPAKAAKTAKGEQRMSTTLEMQINDADSGESEEEEEEEPYWMHEDFMGYEDGGDPSQSRRPSVANGVLGDMAAARQRAASASSGFGLESPKMQMPNGGQGGNAFYMQPAAAGHAPFTSPPPPPEGLRGVRDSNGSGNSERNRMLSGMNFATTTIDNGGRMTHQQHTPAMSSSTAGESTEGSSSSVSANMEHQRILSGLNFATTNIDDGGRMTHQHHTPAMSNSTVGGSSSSDRRTLSTGLGLSGFSDFKFEDSAPPSRPGSGNVAPAMAGEFLQSKENRRTRDSETIPRNVDWTAESLKASPALTGGWDEPNFNRWDQRPSSPLVSMAKPGADEDDEDDMYFDDGGFEQDVSAAPVVMGGEGEVVDESRFDDPNFLARNNNHNSGSSDDNAHAAPASTPPRPPAQHQREASALGSDGPYPPFAMPNPIKARERDSRLLLEDLPLHAGPVDPMLIPRRNPSEDAKRLGLSSRAPALPPQLGGEDERRRVEQGLQRYHAALAEAANRAAVEGRFLRVPSSTSGSTRSKESQLEREDSRGEKEVETDAREGAPQNGVAQDTLQGPANDTLPVPAHYSGPKLNFDFGFDSFSTNTFSPNPLSADAMGGSDDEYDALLNDDDIVAAANAEVLASDDAGFYGQEFGFFANARPNSGEVQAVNGGFFGQDGDDGLMRNKSLREPNLTPITERSEFSTRNSFIASGHASAHGSAYGASAFGPASAGPMSAGGFAHALARIPFSPLEGEVTSFDQLRKLRAQTFRGSNASSLSDGGRNSQSSLLMMREGESPTLSLRSSGGAAHGYFGAGGVVGVGGSSDGSSSGGQHSHAQAQQQQQQQWQESPRSAASSGQMPFSGDGIDATPKRGSGLESSSPLTAKKTSAAHSTAARAHGHSRNSSGADSVAYVQEQSPDGHGPPRWVLERRRTSEQGQLELIGREVVQGGWI